MHHKIELQRARTVHNTMLWQNSDTRTFCRAIQIYSNTLTLYCWPRFFFSRLTHCFSTIYKNRRNTLERWRACFRCILTEIGGYCGKPLMEPIFCIQFFLEIIKQCTHTLIVFHQPAPKNQVWVDDKNSGRMGPATIVVDSLTGPMIICVAPGGLDHQLGGVAIKIPWNS